MPNAKLGMCPLCNSTNLLPVFILVEVDYRSLPIITTQELPNKLARFTCIDCGIFINRRTAEQAMRNNEELKLIQPETSGKAN